jgi:hypothetical protein
VSETCALCKYFSPFAPELPGHQSVTGKCRRYPPNIPSSGHERTYPTVFSAQWCGEWKAKTQLTADV